MTYVGKCLQKELRRRELHMMTVKNYSHTTEVSSYSVNFTLMVSANAKNTSLMVSGLEIAEVSKKVYPFYSA